MADVVWVNLFSQPGAEVIDGLNGVVPGPVEAPVDSRLDSSKAFAATASDGP
ncbi:MAG: hypothetical protein WAN48_01680 [Actinomycetes bacterium]